ncbi:hypothetical protein K458DRAFT_410328 [Lentithecium fluviatile CBS 122367]|uniref:Uncharacterized protein n=1 Tax=Lentithecium fluviatile CBS 122367 TaxID=1168545 RepID=A0A6G1IER8_9PLEO|nr:hypothetical protein K458DRAFT_410328 [Lentithecium fluviatile CBS 122367]
MSTLNLSSTSAGVIDSDSSQQDQTNLHSNHVAASSRPLQLPGELRNRIYSHALTAPSGLQCDASPLRSRNPPSKPPSSNTHSERIPESPVLGAVPTKFNQLQYVNRQLRKETKGLELKFNSITFGNQTYPSISKSGEQLVYFIAKLSLSRIHWLSTVMIWSKTSSMWPLKLERDPETNAQIVKSSGGTYCYQMHLHTFKFPIQHQKIGSSEGSQNIHPHCSDLRSCIGKD